MSGVLWSLAEHGYIAVAADYRRKIDGDYRESLFPWREDSDVTAALDWIRADPRVDRSRIATLGFSRGGVFGLLIAARSPEVRAVVAYYPVTDFRHWLEREQPTAMRRFVWRRIDSYFRKQSGAKTEEEFEEMLSRASALDQAEAIRPPVLLVHGREAWDATLAWLASRLEPITTRPAEPSGGASSGGRTRPRSAAAPRSRAPTTGGRARRRRTRSPGP